MISSLVQGYGSEDESDAEEGKGEKKNTKQEDNDTGTAKRELRRRPLSVPSTLENSSRRSKQHRHTQNKNKDKINPEIQARVEKYLEAKRTTQMNINSQLREPKGFRNPYFLQSIFDHFEVEQDGSELPGRRKEKEQEEEEDAYERIALRQRAEAEDRIRNRTKISFVQQKRKILRCRCTGTIDKAREQARKLNEEWRPEGTKMMMTAMKLSAFYLIIVNCTMVL